MKKLERPGVQPMSAYNACLNEVSDTSMNDLFVSNRSHIAQAIVGFDQAATNASWAYLPRMAHGNPNAIVAGTLTKKDLMDLYTNFMVNSTGASRKIYDDILISSSGKCPFCGGIGQVYTLDHYLPKAYFPLYSVFPSNLVPCCRDCNSGKSGKFGLDLQEQTIHPYFDDEKYFEERWVSAEALKTNPVTFKFHCAPPTHWADVEKLRVQRHFSDYKFSKRYSIAAGAEIARVTDVRLGSLNSLSSDTFRSYLEDNARSSAYDLNGWYRTMYHALSNAEWFCNANFSSSDWHLL